MTLENQVLEFSHLTDCDVNNLSISEQANLNTFFTSSNSSLVILLKNLSLVDFLNYTENNMTLVKNAVCKAK